MKNHISPQGWQDNKVASSILTRWGPRYARHDSCACGVRNTSSLVVGSCLTFLSLWRVALGQGPTNRLGAFWPGKFCLLTLTCNGQSYRNQVQLSVGQKVLLGRSLPVPAATLPQSYTQRRHQHAAKQHVINDVETGRLLCGCHRNKILFRAPATGVLLSQVQVLSGVLGSWLLPCFFLLGQLVTPAAVFCCATQVGPTALCTQLAQLLRTTRTESKCCTWWYSANKKSSFIFFCLFIRCVWNEQNDFFPHRE